MSRPGSSFQNGMKAIRKTLFASVSEKKFKHRGREILRIEGLSDAVFAFSVSLLVASLEVPQTFTELKSIAAGAIPFFATVAMIFLFWYQQYVFFRRYGLNDFKTIFFNLLYLAVILYYVYPLKFLFSLLISGWSGLDLFAKASQKGLTIVTSQEFPQLIILFSIGYLVIWLLIYLMHKHVLHQQKAFHFSTYELLLTKMEARGALWNAFIGASSLLLAWLHFELSAGICYFFIPVAMALNYYLFKSGYKKRLKLVNREHPVFTG